MIDEQKLIKAYKQQKKNSKYRTDALGNPIQFLLTLEEFKAIWVESGVFELRGKTIGSYCMCRKGDIGNYEVGNVFIGLHSENVRNSHKNFHSRVGQKHGRFAGTVIATCMTTGKTITLNGRKEIESAGFTQSNVSACLTGRLKHHKNHTFVRISIS